MSIGQISARVVTSSGELLSPSELGSFSALTIMLYLFCGKKQSGTGHGIDADELLLAGSCLSFKIRTIPPQAPSRQVMIIY